jgi:hypothetical protein
MELAPFGTKAPRESIRALEELSRFYLLDFTLLLWNKIINNLLQFEALVLKNLYTCPIVYNTCLADVN